MKKVALLSFGLIAAVVFVFWPQERMAETHSRFVAMPSGSVDPRAQARSADEQQQQNWNAEVEVSANSIHDTLRSIRMKLARLNETPKADKGMEDERLAELGAFLTDENAAEIAQALSPEELNSRFGLAALERWLKADALTAANWIAARANGTDEQAWIVANRLAQDDALLEEYCARLPGGEWRQLFLKQAVLGMLWRDPQAALRLVQGMSPGDAQRELLQTAACSWMISDPGPASEWITRVPDSLLREQLVCAGTKTYASTNPMASISWLITCIPVPSEAAEPLVEETVRDVFGTWGESNPAEAAQATAQFPRGDLRDTTVSRIASLWLERDPAAALAWIKTLPERDRIPAAFRLE